MATTPTVAGQQGAQQPVDEFEIMRRRLRQRGAAAGEGRQRDLNRQFAATGNLPSGAAFRIRQQAAEAAGRQTSENLQDVNVLQAQTQRAEREGAANRELQRFGITQQVDVTKRGQDIGLQTATLSADTQKELAELQVGSALELQKLSGIQAEQIEAIRGKFGAAAQDKALAASRENLATQIQANKDLQQLDLSSKVTLAQMDHENRMDQLGIADNTARYLGEMELGNQLTIAQWDKDLRQQGTDIQKLMADQNIATTQIENKLNTMATFVNAIAPMKEAGFQSGQIMGMMETLGIDFGREFVGKQFEVILAEAQAAADAPGVPTNTLPLEAL